MVQPPTTVYNCEEPGRLHAAIAMVWFGRVYLLTGFMLGLLWYACVSEEEISMEVGCDGQVAMELMETFTLPHPSSRTHALLPPPPKAGEHANPDALATASTGEPPNAKKDPPKKKPKATPKQASRCCVPVALKLRTRATSITLYRVSCQGANLELHVVGDVQEFKKAWVAAANTAAGQATTTCAVFSGCN